MIRAIVQARSRAIKEVTVGRAGASLEECKIHDSQFYYEGKNYDIGIYDRSLLSEGMQVKGPAIVSEMDSTTVILPGHQATVDSIGNLLINVVP